MGQEMILHAAVMSETGLIFIGKCHADCFAKINNVGLFPMHMAQAQGFMTSEGRYVNREKGFDIAKKANQIEGVSGVLCSEDFWSKEHGGKYEYDEIKGYYLKDVES